MRMRKKSHGDERRSLLSGFTLESTVGFYDRIKEIYGNDKPLRIEIGCGKGDFIREKSVREPDYNYLAIEKVADVCVIAVENYARSRGLGDLAKNGGWEKPNGEIFPLGSDPVEFTMEEKGNVRFIVGDAAQLLKELPDSCADAIYVNFCDPWKKKGHAKRRLTYIEFLKMYSRVLVKDGTFNFKTDNRPLFDFSLEEVEKSPFELVYHTFDLHNSEKDATNIRTEYERNFSAKGFSINMLIAKNEK